MQVYDTITKSLCKWSTYEKPMVSPREELNKNSETLDHLGQGFLFTKGNKHGGGNNFELR